MSILGETTFRIVAESDIYSRLNATQNVSGDIYIYIYILGETTLRIVAAERDVYSRRNTTQNGSVERYLF